MEVIHKMGGKILIYKSFTAHFVGCLANARHFSLVTDGGSKM